MDRSVYMKLYFLEKQITKTIDYKLKMLKYIQRELLSRGTKKFLLYSVNSYLTVVKIKKIY